MAVHGRAPRERPVRPNGQLTVDVRLTSEERHEALLTDARRGLTASPKTISPVWFYDERGSQLFDEITRLPEYYPTRAERALLEAHAADIATATGADTLIELGSGTSEKTRVLLDAMDAAGTLRCYVPFDVSEETLRDAATHLAGVFPHADIAGIVGDFNRHLDAIPEGGRRLVAFLGGTIGNLAPVERKRFLFDLNCALLAEDWLLLGVDLVKEPTRLVAAYDDASGVTAEFNRNALRVLNEVLDAAFDPALFEHACRWDPHEQWIEMHLRSTTDQVVSVGKLGIDVSFRRGETLRTEISAKFTAERISAELDEAGFVVEQAWEAEDGFLLLLARPYC